MMRVPSLTRAILPLALLPQIAAATYWVDPGGNDSAAGTADAPWKTLQRAADAVGAGDTVIVRAGAYAGFALGWDHPVSGTADAPITFQAMPGASIVSRNDNTPDGIDLEGASFVVIDGFRVDNAAKTMDRAGIRAVHDRGVVIRNNDIHGAGNWGVFTSFSDNVLIENNTAAGSIRQHGIYVSNTCVAPAIRGNQVFGNRGNGIHLNGDVSQGGRGIIVGALIENNVVYGNGRSGGSAINCDGVQSSIIRNNLVYDNHAHGISLYRIDASQGSKRNLVINNTVIVAADGRWALNIKNGSTGNVIRNNILISKNPRTGSISVSGDSARRLISDHNILGGRLSQDGGDRMIGLSAWRTRTKQDRQSRLASPAELFVNAPGGDYRLSASSPAIGRGTAENAPPTDIAGNPRIGRVDAGAFQAAGAAVVPAERGTPLRARTVLKMAGAIGAVIALRRWRG